MEAVEHLFCGGAVEAGQLFLKAHRVDPEGTHDVVVVGAVVVIVVGRCLKHLLWIEKQWTLINRIKSGRNICSLFKQEF